MNLQRGALKLFTDVFVGVIPVDIQNIVPLLLGIMSKNSVKGCNMARIILLWFRRFWSLANCGLDRNGRSFVVFLLLD